MSSNTAVPFVPAAAPFNAQQRAWLNGYFAGLMSFADVAGESAAAMPAPVETKKALLILYGSQSGTAEGLAKKFGKEAGQNGFDAQVVEANRCTLAELAKAERLALVISTWGEGDPPD